MPGDEEAIRKTVHGFAEAWNGHDMDALADLFAADGEFVNVAGRRWSGRDAIQTNHAFTHATIPQGTAAVEHPPHVYGVFRTSTFRFHNLDVKLVRPDVAVAHATWTILGDARTKEPRRGIMTIVAIRDGGRWLLSAVQNTEIERTVG